MGYLVKKKLLALFVIILFSANVAIVASEETKLSPIIIGTTSGYAPYVSLNTEGQYEGFDIDLSRFLGEKLKREVVFKDFGSMPGLLLALKQKRVDMVIWAISITKDRMEKMDFVYYQGAIIETTPFLFWKQIPPGLETINDLEKIPNSVVCVEAGSAQEDLLKSFPNLKLKYADKVLDIIMDLRYGKCLTTTVDPGVVPGYVKKHPELKVVELPLPEHQKMFGNGIAIDKSNSELTEKVRVAIAQLTSEGKIAELEKKWNMEG